MPLQASGSGPLVLKSNQRHCSQSETLGFEGFTSLWISVQPGPAGFLLWFLLLTLFSPSCFLLLLSCFLPSHSRTIEMDFPLLLASGRTNGTCLWWGKTRQPELPEDRLRRCRNPLLPGQGSGGQIRSWQDQQVVYSSHTTQSFQADPCLGRRATEEGLPPLHLSSGLCQYLETGSQDPGPKNQGN